jgi:hypothetical protein
MWVDRGRYKAAIDELGNDYELGHDNYHKDIPGVVTMFSNKRHHGAIKKIDEMKDEILTSFGQTSTPEGRVCHFCGTKGHIVRYCKKLKTKKHFWYIDYAPNILIKSCLTKSVVESFQCEKYLCVQFFLFNFCVQAKAT